MFIIEHLNDVEKHKKKENHFEIPTFPTPHPHSAIGNHSSRLSGLIFIYN